MLTMCTTPWNAQSANGENIIKDNPETEIQVRDLHGDILEGVATKGRGKGVVYHPRIRTWRVYTII